MRVPELMGMGINVAFGHDDIMDPWYPMGTHDMLEVAHMGAHALHMTGVDGLKKMFAAVTVNGAKVLGLEGYGLTPGCNADMVILLYRPAAYMDTQEYEMGDNTSQIIIAKHRHGSTGVVKLLWQGEYTRFRSIAQENQ